MLIPPTLLRPRRGATRQMAAGPTTVEFVTACGRSFVLHGYVRMSTIRSRYTYRNTAPYAGQMCDVLTSFLMDWELRGHEAGALVLKGPVGARGRANSITWSWNWLVCQIEHYQRAVALDGSGQHRLGSGLAAKVGFDASLLWSCQAVLGSVKSSPQVLDFGVIELARTMSRGPRARNGQNTSPTGALAL